MKNLRPYYTLTKFLFFLYLFFVSIELMGTGFGLFGKGFADAMLKPTHDPFLALLIGLLSTAIVQSSSCTTSIIVGLVASGVLPLQGAVPMIMGANIGTTVTSMIVAMMHVSNRVEFRRAIQAATVHDFFNLLTVCLLFPMEMKWHFLEHGAIFLSQAFEGIGGVKMMSPLKVIVSPIVHGFKDLVLNVLHMPEKWAATLVLAFSLVSLFTALSRMVSTMRSATMDKVEVLIDKYLFASPLRALTLGMLITATIQSSSVTTSLVVPLAAGGILTLEALFPFVLGANIGTTITAILASLVTGSVAAITISLVHLLFNITGTLIFLPFKFMRSIPISMAVFVGKISERNRWIGMGYMIIAFYIIPLLIFFLRS